MAFCWSQDLEKKNVAALDQMIRAKKVLAICLTSDLSLSHLS